MPEVDLGLALDAVIAALAAEFSSFRTIAAEDESRRKLPVPAILVEVSEIEPDPDADPHTGQFPCLVHLEARLVMGHRTPRVRREVLKAAAALAAFVHNQRLGVAWGAATVIAVEPDEFAPSADQFDIWRVEWVHSAHLGSSFLVDDGVTPTTVLSSWSPNTGVENEAEYEDLAE